MKEIRFTNIYLFFLAVIFFVLGVFAELHFYYYTWVKSIDVYPFLYPKVLHLIFFLFSFVTISSIYFIEKRETKILSLANMALQRELDNRKRVEEGREKLINKLKKALVEVKTLRGILPLCSFCKRIRDDKGYWEQVDVYIHKYSEADISHSICPGCMKKHYPEEYEDMYPTEE